MSNMLGLVVAFMVIIIYIGIIALGIANYIITSLSLHTIAQRRQIKNSWLAWTPVASDWIIGSLSDDYDLRNGIKRKWRIVLTIINISFIALFLISLFVFIVGTVSFAIQSEYTYMEPESVLGFIIPLYIFWIVAMIGAVTLSICRSICFYKIFESTVPEKTVKYFLLSILIPFALAICLFKCKDKGYSANESAIY